MSVRTRVVAIGLALAVVILSVRGISRPSAVEAHPLGNFTVNRYSRLDLYRDSIRISYVLDMAEIPTFQELNIIDTDGDGQPSLPENEAYLSTKSAELLEGLSLTVDGTRQDLRVLARNISYPLGQAGLRTLRLSLVLDAAAPVGDVSISYEDKNYADRVGWKEIVVQPAPGVVVANSTASSEDVSQALTTYPKDLLSSPLDVTSATLRFDATKGALAPSAPVAIAAPDRAPARAGAGFAGLISTDKLTLPVLLLSLLLALGFGAFHALEPGHGKTFVAAYFVGTKGTVRQAMSLGLIIAVTHTIGVLAIGMLALFGSRVILPERLYPWLSLASGLMILALGVRLVLARASSLNAWRRLVATVRRDDGHAHAHAHGHSHAPQPDGAPPWKSLIALGLADGLTPSPSALVVLLAALSLDRIGLGLLLIVAFSLGLAAVLTSVSVALIYARRFLDWLSRSARNTDRSAGLGWVTLRLPGGNGLLNLAPVGGACALVAIGVLLTVRALSQPGLPLF